MTVRDINVEILTKMDTLFYPSISPSKFTESLVEILTKMDTLFYIKQKKTFSI